MDRGTDGEFHFYRTRCDWQLEGVMSSIDERQEAPDPGDLVCDACVRAAQGNPADPSGRGDVVMPN
jgi:hypothetical protein